MSAFYIRDTAVQRLRGVAELKEGEDRLSIVVDG